MWLDPVAFQPYLIGSITTSLFGLLSRRVSAGRTIHEWAEPGAVWLLNLELVAFIATEFGTVADMMRL